MTTGEKIAGCRKGKNLTQSQLAELLGVTRQAVSRWESDLAFPETDNLIMMSKLFGCTTDWLLKYDGDENGVREEAEQKTFNLADYLKNFYFEYKSKTKLGNLPLVHINIGAGRTAKGVFAVGIKSAGIVSVGVFSMGLLSFGVFCLGLIGLGAFVAGILSAGAVALGVIAVGAICAGLFSIGALSTGLFAVGAYAAGYYTAIGNVAYGGIALGCTVAEGGVYSATVDSFKELSGEIYNQFDALPAFWGLFTNWCKGIFEGILNGTIILGGQKI